MESELGIALQVIDDLTTFTDGQEAIKVAQRCLKRLQNDKRHFPRVYAAICVKIFQLTCDLPYQEVSKLMSLAPPNDVIVTLCACIASSRYGSSVLDPKPCLSSKLKISVLGHYHQFSVTNTIYFVLLIIILIRICVRQALDGASKMCIVASQRIFMMKDCKEWLCPT